MAIFPLRGHVSRETAYQVSSYPYGRLRCKIWFWLEYGGDNKGWRFCSQTENPKNGRLNAPKKGTYSKFAMNMYLDENDHVQVKAVNEYSSAQEVYDFVKAFYSKEMDSTTLNTLMGWCKAKYRYERTCVEKKASPYGPLSEHRVEECAQNMRMWWRCHNLLTEKPEDTAEV